MYDGMEEVEYLAKSEDRAHQRIASAEMRRLMRQHRQKLVRSRRPHKLFGQNHRQAAQADGDHFEVMKIAAFLFLALAITTLVLTEVLRHRSFVDLHPIDNPDATRTPAPMSSDFLRIRGREPLEAALPGTGGSKDRWDP